MAKTEAEKIIDGGIRILSVFLPLKTYLYFPLLYSAAVWAGKRATRWKESVLAWQVWLDPEMVENKPDAFILDFFESHPVLKPAYAREIRGKDMERLSRDFHRLYPVFGLEDPFLRAIFSRELECGEIKAVAEEFDARVAQAKSDIQAAALGPRFWRRLKGFAGEFSSFFTHLLLDVQVQKIIAARVQEWLEKREG